MIWSKVEHKADGVRLALSEQHGPDVDLLMSTAAAKELGSALRSRGGVSCDAKTVDDEPTVISIVGDVIMVEIEGESPMMFSLADQSTTVGAELLAHRPRQPLRRRKTARLACRISITLSIGPGGPLVSWRRLRTAGALSWHRDRGV